MESAAAYWETKGGIWEFYEDNWWTWSLSSTRTRIWRSISSLQSLLAIELSQNGRSSLTKWNLAIQVLSFDGSCPLTTLFYVERKSSSFVVSWTKYLHPNEKKLLKSKKFFWKSRYFFHWKIQTNGFVSLRNLLQKTQKHFREDFQFPNKMAHLAVTIYRDF